MIDGASLIIFDTDGTLVDGRRAIIDAVAEGLIATYEHFEIAAREPDRERIALAMGLPSTAFFRTAFDPTGVPAALHDAFASEFEVRSTRAEVAALRRGESCLYAGAAEALDALRASGHRLALISNASEPYFRTVVEVHGLTRWFERTICLEQAVRRRLARTKAGMVRHLARGFAHVAVVGDRIHDIDAGMAVGARTVGCSFGFGEAAEFAAADWVVDSLAELPRLPWRAAAAAPLSADAADRA